MGRGGVKDCEEREEIVGGSDGEAGEERLSGGAGWCRRNWLGSSE